MLLIFAVNYIKNGLILEPSRDQRMTDESHNGVCHWSKKSNQLTAAFFCPITTYPLMTSSRLSLFSLKELRSLVRTFFFLNIKTRLYGGYYNNSNFVEYLLMSSIHV